jgi:hypothetical protein
MVGPTSYLNQIAEMESCLQSVLADERSDQIYRDETEDQLVRLRALRQEVVETFAECKTIVRRVVVSVGLYAAIKTAVIVHLGFKAPANVVVDLAWAVFNARAWLRAQGRAGIPRRAARAFSVLSAILPPRIADEELGDALEDIARRVRSRRPMWEIELKVAMTVVWSLLHAVEDVVARVAKIVNPF